MKLFHCKVTVKIVYVIYVICDPQSLFPHYLKVRFDVRFVYFTVILRSKKRHSYTLCYPSLPVLNFRTLKTEITVRRQKTEVGTRKCPVFWRPTKIIENHLEFCHTSHNLVPLQR